MKRFFLMSTLLLVALLAGAQTKVAPKMAKGMKKTYASEATIKNATQKPLKISTQTIFEVTDATPDGYVIDALITDVKHDADQSDMKERIVTMSTEMLKGIHTTYATDKEGKVTKILNYDEIKEKTMSSIDNMLDQIPMDSEEAKTMMGNVKEMIREQVINKLTEESMVESLQANTSPLALNGKTITTGTEEEFKNDMGIKMKRTYTVKDKKTILSSAVINMSAEDMKQMMYNLLEKLMPGVKMTDEIKKGMESMLGKVKIEAKEETAYTLKDDGWVDTITSEGSASSMGQGSVINTKVWLVK